MIWFIAAIGVLAAAYLLAKKKESSGSGSYTGRTYISSSRTNDSDDKFDKEDLEDLEEAERDDPDEGTLIVHPHYYDDTDYECSECHARFKHPFKRCPECDAVFEDKTVDNEEYEDEEDDEYDMDEEDDM